MALPHIQFNSSQAATTPYFPSNGVGGWTATAADSLADTWEKTELRRLVCPGSASGAQLIEFYHGDGTLAATFGVQQQTQELDLSWAQGEGPTLLGRWYIEFPSVASATDLWFVQFERSEVVG